MSMNNGPVAAGSRPSRLEVVALISIFLLATGGSPLLAQLVPLGGDFQVNTYTTSGQGIPAIAFAPNGEVVVIWISYGSAGSDASGASVQGQRYEAGGAPIGAEFQINTHVPQDQLYPEVGRSAEGFAVVWESESSPESDDDRSSVQARVYDENGVALGSQFQVNSYTPGFQLAPDVAMAADGDLLVVWQSGSDFGDTDSTSIQGQLYDAGGGIQGSQFQINTCTTGGQIRPAVAATPAGGFVVVWESNGSGDSDTDGWSIQGQRVSDAGTLVGSQFQVNSYTSGNQEQADVAVAPNGDVFVTWESRGSPGSDNAPFEWSVQGRRFTATTTPLGGQFQINTATGAFEQEVTVAYDASGEAVVAWQSDALVDDRILGQVYGGDGVPLGGNMELNAYTAGGQATSLPAVAANRGQVWAAWQATRSPGSDDSSNMVLGRRFANLAWIFGDGFESGSTTAWSKVSP